MRNPLVVALMLLAAVVLTTEVASADTWSQGFVMNKETTGSAWDEAVLVLTSMTFAGAGITNISDAAWAPGTMNAEHTMITIDGPARLSNLYFTLTFAGAPSTPFTLDSFQYLNGVLLAGDTTHLVWDGSTWSATLAPDLRAPVPEPGTLLLVLAGLGGITGASWRRARRAA
jgi:hypothetical protein